MVETLQSHAPRIDVECMSILANTNTVFNAISYNKERSILAYACANQVLLSTTTDKPRVMFSLDGHTARVNSVVWVDTNTVVSVSDKIVIHQCQSSNEDHHQGQSWITLQVIEENKEQTMYLSVIENTPNKKLFSTMSNDGMLRLYWLNNDGKFVEKANLAFGRNL
jgi:hypothetical protein